MNEIKGFFEDFRFLSNFWYADVVFEGVTYRSTEVAYQAAKSLDLDERKKFVGLTSGQAKRLGQKIQLREDWDFIRLQVMYDICKDKFTRHADLKELLLLTGDAYLEETNTWNDTFWGVCAAAGENNLGKTLMKIREEILNA